MERQYITVKFRESEKRSYTYHNEGKPVSVGELVKVPDRSGGGWTRATVFGLVSAAEAEALPFKTKAILGRIEPEQPAQGELMPGTDKD